MADDPLSGCTGFDWDEGNLAKNWERHRVAFWETEEIFFNEPLVVSPDRKHSISESRYLALGHADSGRKLFISYAIRGSLVRIISARDMTRRELRTHEQSKTQAVTKVRI